MKSSISMKMIGENHSLWMSFRGLFINVNLHHINVNIFRINVDDIKSPVFDGVMTVMKQLSTLIFRWSKSQIGE